MTDEIKEEILRDLEEQIFDIPKENFSNKRKWIMQLIKAHLDDFADRIREDEREKVRPIVQAWKVIGRNLHKQDKHYLMTFWPTLYYAIETYINSLTTKS